MKKICPVFQCASRKIVRYGTYYRSNDRRRIQRYRCETCYKVFSASKLLPTYRQKKRHLNFKVHELICSNVTQRRTASLLRVNRKTVVRKIRFGAEQVAGRHEKFLANLSTKKAKLDFVQFDDLETSEHTKCKPLSVALAVEPKTRKILSFKVSKMPPKGALSEIAFRKYGPREDLRRIGWDALMRDLKPVLSEESILLSDQNPHYEIHVKNHFPKGTHATVKSRRARPGGQGELKRGANDPIFAINHSCAMLRANMSRLIRKTWANTKNAKGLIDHLWLYIDYHNRNLTKPISEKGKKESTL